MAGHKFQAMDCFIFQNQEVSDAVTEWLSEWQGHLLSCSGQLKTNAMKCQKSSNVKCDWAIYWTLPPGSFFGSFFKGKIEKMKVMGPFEIWNKRNVARTPVLASTSPPPPFALFSNVTFSVPKSEITFWVDCEDSKVPLTPKLIVSISYQQTFTFTFLQLFLCFLSGRNGE